MACSTTINVPFQSETPKWQVKQTSGYLYSEDIALSRYIVQSKITKFVLKKVYFEINIHNKNFVLNMNIPDATCMDDITCDNLTFVLYNPNYSDVKYTVKTLPQLFKEFDLPDLSNIDISKISPEFTYLEHRYFDPNYPKVFGFTFDRLVVNQWPYFGHDVRLQIQEFAMDIYNKCLSENTGVADIEED